MRKPRSKPASSTTRHAARRPAQAHNATPMIPPPASPRHRTQVAQRFMRGLAPVAERITALAHNTGSESGPATVSQGLGGMTRNDDWQGFNPADPTFLIRQQLLDLMIDPRHEIDKECGYPPDITPLMYHLLYQRDGIAKRVVDLWPDESWAIDPVVYEQEDQGETAFEKAWDALLKRLNLWHWLHRIDRLSGVGRYGVLLLGLDDNQSYDQPAGGLNAKGLPDAKSAKKHKLLFLRAFEESAVQVLQREINPRNPRYGQPTRYLVTFRELDITEPAMMGTTAGGMSTSQVHWTRIIHVADNREMSEIYGTPRMKAVFNRICDVRKLMGGSGEMFWKGAFPGTSFELNPGVGANDVDPEEIREEMARYQNGLQRYIALAGLTAKSLSPQVADPKGHVDAQMDQIAVSIGIPKRILFGTEEAKLASSQDVKTWNKRLARRQDKYVGPLLIRPLVDRLVDLGVLPRPKGEYQVHWPDLAAGTDLEKADLALKRTQALAAYMTGQVDNLISPQDFLATVMDIDIEEVEQILKATEDYMATKTEEWDGEDRPDEEETKPTQGQSKVSVELAVKNPAEES